MIEDKIKEWSKTKEKEFDIVIKFYPERILNGVSLHGKKVMLDLGYNEGIFTMVPDYFPRCKNRKTPEERAMYRYYTYPKNPNKFILLNRGGQALTGYHDTLEEAINELFSKE